MVVLTVIGGIVLVVLGLCLIAYRTGKARSELAAQEHRDRHLEKKWPGGPK